MKSQRLLATMFVVVGLTSCATGGHYEVSPVEFVRLAETQTGSVFYSDFLGTTKSHAFLQVWRGPGWFGGAGDRDVYSVALDALPGPVAAKVRSGENPWPK